ncbi:DUF368 domain-containing protein [Bacteroidota bacterium]
MKNYLVLFLKGMGMGAANVIPGVSGGTIALITGIFEELINSIKSFDVIAVKLLFTGKWKAFSKHVNLVFLLIVFTGAFASIFSLAVVLKFLFTFYPVFIWAFFFGLIIASVIFVGRNITSWNSNVVVLFIIGAAIAVTISFLSPATQNEALWYLFICGIVAVCSMILPGLSGSFVLILMGNYQLVMINAVKDLNLKILLPVAIGAGFGLIAFSHLLSWLFKKFKDQTISLLTGFILGSLAILWPWKVSYDINGKELITNSFGAFINSNGLIIEEEIKISAYKQFIPEAMDSTIFLSVGFMIIGFIVIYLIEKFAESQNKTQK